MTDQFRLSTDQTLLGPDGRAMPNGQVHFYERKTHRYAAVYGDPGKQVTLHQPVQADAHGVLPVVFLDDCTDYCVVIADAQNNRLREVADVGRFREGIKVLDGLEALQSYCGDDAFVLVAGNDACPRFYRRLQACGELPAQHLPDIVHTKCCEVWQLCRQEPVICAQETAELNCEYQVLVQECKSLADEVPGDCPCGSAPAPAAPAALKKASIGALLSAATRCMDRVCIPYDAPEFALVGNTMVYGDREPAPIQDSVLSGSFSGCIRVYVGSQADAVSRHVRLDTIRDLNGVPVYYPRLTLTNNGSCKRRYELRALNRLNRAKEAPSPGVGFGEVPLLDANFQTRLAKESDPLIDAGLGVADFLRNLPWMTELSIADSTMGPFRSGYVYSGPANDHPFASANGYTENTLLVDVAPGASITYALKFHIYWDMNAPPELLARAVERLHFGTRLMARQIS